jgi:hypothetical protein
MAPTKRARPSFSPPRPNKSNRKAASGVTTKTQRTDKKRASFGSKSKSKPSTSKHNTSSTRRDSTGLTGDSDSNPNSDNDESQSDASHSPTASPSRSPSQSPSRLLPDTVLVTPYQSSQSSDTRIPDALIHHIVNAHFQHPEKTKLSKDARTLVGTYVNTFVREGLFRCVKEKQGREKGEVGGEKGSDEGWLEVGDLERVSVQLVLDF